MNLLNLKKTAVLLILTLTLNGLLLPAMASAASPTIYITSVSKTFIRPGESITVYYGFYSDAPARITAKLENPPAVLSEASQAYSVSGNGTGSLTLTVPASAADQTVDLRLYISSVNGTGTSLSWPLKIDTQRPLVDLIGLQEVTPNHVRGRLTIIGTAQDANLNEYTLTYYGPGVPTTTLARGTTSIVSQALIYLETIGMADGSYVFTLTASDLAGNPTETKTRHVVVDNTPPSITISSPASGSWAGGVVTVNGSVKDLNLATYNISYAHGSNAASGFNLVTTGTTAVPDGLLGRWDTSSVPAGYYTLQVEAFDKAGNSSTARVNLRIDNAGGQVAILSPAKAIYTNTLPMTFSVTYRYTESNPVSATVALLRDPSASVGVALAQTRVTGIAAGIDIERTDILTVPRELTAGEYYLVVDVADVSGNPGRAKEKLFIYDVEGPQAAELAALPRYAGQGTVTLNWKDKAGKDSSGIVRYEILRSRDGNAFATVRTLDAPETALVDTDLTSGPVYYMLKTFDAAGNFALSKVATVTVDNDPPSPPVVNSLPDRTPQESVSLTWSQSMDRQAGVKEYQVWRSTDNQNFILIKTLPAPETGYADKDVKDGFRYYYKVIAVDAAVPSNRSESKVVHTAVNTGKPEAPVIASLPDYLPKKEVLLDWTENPGADPGTGIQSYEVHRSTDGKNFEKVATLNKKTPAGKPATIHVDAGLQHGRKYWWKVRAVNALGLMSDSAAVSTTVDAVVPKAPFLYQPPNSLAQGFTLRWQAALDETSGIERYEVRQSVDGRNYDLVGTAVGSATTANLSAPNGIYWYKVVAFDRAGNSAESNVVTTKVDFTPPLASITIGKTVTTAIPVSWAVSDSYSGVAGYVIETSTDKKTWTKWKENAPERSDLFEGEHGKRYYFRIKATDAQGNESPYAEAEALAQRMVFTVAAAAPAYKEARFGTIVASIGKGQELTVLGYSDGWYRVVLPGGQTGYIFWNTGTVKPAPAAPEIKVYVNGQRLTFEEQPYLEDNRVLIPIRAIVEVLGAQVTWDEKAQTVGINREGIAVTLKVDDKKATVGSKTVTLEAAARIRGGRTFVPLRFLSEAFKAQVNWDSASRTVRVDLR